MIVYLDNAASTKPYDEVAEYCRDTMLNNYANPSALHSFGESAKKIYSEAADKILPVLGLKNRKVIFTSGATESVNLAVKGIIEKISEQTKYNIVTTSFEHPCVTQVFAYYKNKGVGVSFIPVDRYGNLDEEKLLSSVNDKTKLVSLIWVNNEIGSIIDVNDLTKKIKSINPRTLVHVDATQGFGKINEKLTEPDMISISGHKFHAPKGVGALIIKPEIVLFPQMLGGGHQDNLRSGTINAPAIGAMALACEILQKNKPYDILFELNDYLYSRIKEKFGEGVINTVRNKGVFSPHILSVSFEGIKSEVLVHMMEQYDIYLSTSSACASHGNHESVLKSLGFTKKRIEGTVRISLSEFNTIEELNYFTEKFEEAVKRLSGLNLK